LSHIFRWSGHSPWEVSKMRGHRSYNSYKVVALVAVFAAALLAVGRTPAQNQTQKAPAPASAAASAPTGQPASQANGQLNPQMLDDLVYANRILANEGIVDGFGHVSVREDNNPDRFVMSRSMAPALVTRKDLMEYNLNGDAIDPQGRALFAERYIHAAIYRARPDVKAIVHSHSLAVIPFSVTGIGLRPIFHMSAFLGAGTPIFDIRDVAGDSNMLVNDNKLGDWLAKVLGNHSVALMRGHGSVDVGTSIPEVVFFAYYTDVNARLQAQSAALGMATFLTPGEASKSAANLVNQYGRAWDLWKEKVGKID
jgi:ribulose-5-phosphate 4-epimerase/fuculose-1-phosphate aldolase